MIRIWVIFQNAVESYKESISLSSVAFLPQIQKWQEFNYSCSCWPTRESPVLLGIWFSLCVGPPERWPMRGGHQRSRPFGAYWTWLTLDPYPILLQWIHMIPACWIRADESESGKWDGGGQSLFVLQSVWERLCVCFWGAGKMESGRHSKMALMEPLPRQTLSLKQLQPANIPLQIIMFLPSDWLSALSVTVLFSFLSPTFSLSLPQTFNGLSGFSTAHAVLLYDSGSDHVFIAALRSSCVIKWFSFLKFTRLCW